jgi:tripeptide aminopeptidase
VCAVRVVEELAREGEAEGVAVAFTVGEEGLGNLAGARSACETLQPDLALALEGHGLAHVAVDGVGSLRARITVRGPGGHSWANRGRPSAIDEVCRIARTLSRQPRGDASTNIGLIQGGTAVNAIAAHAELVIEQRALDETLLARFGRALQALTVEPPLTLEIEEVGRRPAGRLDRRQPLLATVRRVREELGLPDELVAASTDANAALAAGIPALCLGCATGGEMHTPGEYIDIGSLASGREQLRSVLRALLWDNPGP